MDATGNTLSVRSSFFFYFFAEKKQRTGILTWDAVVARPSVDSSALHTVKEKQFSSSYRVSFRESQQEGELLHHTFCEHDRWHRANMRKEGSTGDDGLWREGEE